MAVGDEIPSAGSTFQGNLAQALQHRNPTRNGPSPLVGDAQRQRCRRCRVQDRFVGCRQRPISAVRPAEGQPLGNLHKIRLGRQFRLLASEVSGQDVIPGLPGLTDIGRIVGLHGLTEVGARMEILEQTEAGPEMNAARIRSFNPRPALGFRRNPGLAVGEPEAYLEADVCIAIGEVALDIDAIVGDEASDTIQALMDSGKVSPEDKGWYLQERARYLHQADRVEALNLQVAAHTKDRLLLKPPTGVSVSKLKVVSHGRVEPIIDWVSSKGTYEDLNVAVSDIFGRLVFGVKADRFEQAVAELSRALGFAGERPDKEWKEGPDNLWALDDQTYLLIECKNEVDTTRAEINKRETEQMNRSSAWFDKHYKGMSVKRLMVHPAGKLESAAALTHDVEGVREADLKRLVTSCRDFFKSFQTQNLADLSTSRVQKMLNLYKLTVEDLTASSTDNGYSRKLKNLTR